MCTVFLKKKTFFYFSAAAHVPSMFRKAETEPLIQELSPHFQKPTLLSAFLTWSQFPSILAWLSKPGSCQQLGVEGEEKRDISS